MVGPKEVGEGEGLGTDRVTVFRQTQGEQFKPLFVRPRSRGI